LEREGALAISKAFKVRLDLICVIDLMSMIVRAEARIPVVGSFV